MKFSILHATARLPMGWVDSWREWSNKMSPNSPHEVEYILCVHANDYGKLPFEFLKEQEESPTGIKITVIGRTGKVCANASWNAAAKVSTGDLLILNADDLFPCHYWDLELANACPLPTDQPFVLHIGTGSPRDHELISHPIMSRALYSQLGYIFYPEYESMFGDDDLTELAVKLNVVCNARHIQFRHDNPLFTGGEQDEVFKYTNRDEAYESGRKILARRRAQNFGLGTNAPAQAQHNAVIHSGRSIAVMIPGENFSAAWVANWSVLLPHIQQRFRTGVSSGYCSNVYIIRASMWETIKNEGHDFILWMDDDNLLTGEQFDMLVKDLDDNPDLDGVVGWCWANSLTDSRISCGRFIKDGNGHLPLSVPFTQEELQASPTDLVPIQFSGFPVVLLRGRAIQKAGPLPFTPILVPNVSWGMTGEDVSFFYNAMTRGNARFAVDRRVQVPHLKLSPVVPATYKSPYHEAHSEVVTREEPSAESEQDNALTLRKE